MMNETTTKAKDIVPINAEILQRARILALQSNRNLVTELEVITNIDPRQLVREIASPFGLQVMETADMLLHSPAFDLLPLSKAMLRHCALLRKADGELLGIIADPFDPDLQTWLDTQAKQSLHYVLALQADIQAYLSKQEESVRATDNLAPGSANANDHRRDGKTAAILSFASVSEAASPAVKLVNSTLYDALKAGASDIHLESTAGGLAVKYRVDGVLDHATSVHGIEVAEHVISRLKR